jgi:murein DD-endopeptidase MepM/ murein hydrolase activator NlpD
MASICAWILAAALALPWAGSAAAGSTKVNWPPPIEVLQGQLAQVKVSGENLLHVEGRMGKEILYFYPADDGSFSALVGADLETKPASTMLWLQATDHNGAQQQAEVALKIKAKTYHRESFKVAREFDQMSEETLAEIRREQAAFARAFATSSAERYWETPFIQPVPQDASASSFGSRRIINGIPRAPHAGTDLSAPAGTEVQAANHGRVVLVGNFFFAGGSVVLDHGGGLFTMYFHLSEFKVEEGGLVRRGDVVGLSGATGRVTGPHLHWGVRLNNSRIDPLDMLRKLAADPLKVPESATSIRQEG